MKTYRLYQVDAFTSTLFRGNPAGVVPNADGLSDSQMQDIARELNNSETAFIFSATGADHDVWIRFFTPTTEVPICGHATISAHYVRALENNLKNCRVLHRTGAGILPVDIVFENGHTRVVMTQGTVQFGDIIEGHDRTSLLSALCLSVNDLERNCPIQIVSTGHSKVMVGVSSRAKLNALVPDMQTLTELSARIGCNGYFVFTFDSGDREVLTHGRMFAPAIGIHEDPVTGNANGPLGAFLVRHRLVPFEGPTLRFISRQGEAIRRTGHVHVRVDTLNNEPVLVQVGGEAVVVFQTEISI